MSRFALAIGAFVIVAGVFFIASGNGRNGYDPTAPYQEKVSYWQSRIAAVGANQAYEEMVAAQTGSDAGAEHVEAHIFGSALYRSEGIHGVAVCDERFSYACFHQLIAEALADLGTDSLGTIVDVCIEIPGCRHGIGHGVIGSLGYSADDLQKSIALCATLPRALYVQGCYGGVFMEYNIRSVLGVGQERPLGKDWFESCAHVPQGAERVCYFWQPTWWGHALRSADARLGSSAFKQMGDACRALKRGELRDGCFEGIGVSALNTGRSLADGISGCAEASEDPYAHALCITSIARYIALASVADQGRSVCLDLPALYKDMCVHDIENASPSSSYIGEKLLMEKAI